MRQIFIRQLLIFCGLAAATFGLGLLLPPTVLADGPTIHSITTNAADYPNGQIPTFEKFEITFQVDTVAQNLQLPYDAAPPPGVAPGQGVSVDAHFSPDNWQTVYTQPAFYYQEFQDQVKNNNEWFYPTGNFSWKVRFAPPQVGPWQVKLTAQDTGGMVETQPVTFTVAPSASNGFIRVSQADPRYFEFDDGTYFPGLGYNMNYNQIDWINPRLGNESNFQTMSENGIQLVRLWLSQWAIYGPSWNPWNAIDSNLHGQYIPNAALSFEQAYPGSELSMKVSATWNRCMFIGAWKAKPAVKPNTNYRVRIRYKTTGISGPRVSGKPYGFVAKTGGWLNQCDEPDVGTTVTPHQNQNSAGWQILEGSLTTGNTNFLPNFYLVMDNADQGIAYVDYLWIEEDLGSGNYGLNIVPKPWMAHHMYMEQRNSYAFDKVVALAEQHDIYLRPVIHEKQNWILRRIDENGNFAAKNNSYFYGDRRNVTKVRWLQQAWWRYLQARWGYSPHIHSWELLNEGDPWNDRHYVLTDELGKFMHCGVFGVAVGSGDGDKCNYDHPNDHPVSTSNWHSFPKDNFWANSNYPNVDFADVHQYIPPDDPLFEDAALMHQSASLQYGAQQPGGAGKPVIRGETGFGDANSAVKNDTGGIWLHNYIWSGLNSGGLIESYWYANRHIYFGDVDHRPIYKTFDNFIKDIPLNNGHYQEAQAGVSNPNLRAWGQKDLLNGRAHLWLQNKNHTWKNVVDNVPIPAVSATVTVTGFAPNKEYTVEWWDTYQPTPAQQLLATQTITSQIDGSIVVSVADLQADTALKISEVVQAQSITLPAYWKLNEASGPTYEDSFNSGHNAVCAGTCPGSTAGHVNGGQQFNGFNAGLNIPANPAFDWSAAAAFSVELWVKGVPGQTCAATDEVVIGRVDSSGSPLWSLGCQAGSGLARFQLKDSNGISATLESTHPITGGFWHHLVGVHQHGDTHFYVNGREVASTTVAYAGNFGSTAGLNVGWLNTGLGFHFNGTIDELALHDEALSPTQIRTHFYLGRDYTAACDTPVRIMPLGNSITRGVSSGVSDPAKQISYRKDLWDSLAAAGYSIDFVGTLTHGQFYQGFDPQHEGRSGWRDDQLVAQIYNNGGDNWLNTHLQNNTPADVILLHIGTNDINWHDPNDVDQLLDEINEYEADNNTSVTVIVARMIHRLNYSSANATHNFNNKTEAAALERLNNGDKIIIVDMENGAGINYAQYPNGDMWDWGHPYATGYTKMAQVWFDALKNFLPVCQKEAPAITSTPVTTATVGTPYTYTVAATGTPVPTYTLTTGPADMSINSATGVISWTPPISGSFGVTVQAGNLAGADTQSYIITVAAPVLSPTIVMTTAVSPPDIPEPGGTVTFTVQVENTGAQPVTLTGLVDNIHGNLNGQGDCFLGTTISAGNIYQCSFTAAIFGNAGAQTTNPVTATVEDDNGLQASDSSSATVTLTDVLPTISLTQSAHPTGLPEPGGIVTFTVQVTNTGAEAVTLTGLADDIHGNLNGKGNCALTQSMASGAAYGCSFTAPVFGQAGLQKTDTVTATAKDDENNSITLAGSATVTISNVPSSISIGLSATPAAVTEPGDVVTFTVQVGNTGTVDDVTLNSLVDSLFGPLTATGTLSNSTCLLPQLIAAGNNYTCHYAAFVAGSAGEIHFSQVTAAGQDDDSQPVSANHTASVTINAAPAPDNHTSHLPVILKSK